MSKICTPSKVILSDHESANRIQLKALIITDPYLSVVDIMYIVQCELILTSSCSLVQPPMATLHHLEQLVNIYFPPSSNPHFPEPLLQFYILSH